MLEGYVMNNYNARCDTHSYHSCKETDFNTRVDVKLQQSQPSVKCRSWASGHSACLKGMLSTITMQGLTLAVMKKTLMQGSTQIYDKVIDFLFFFDLGFTIHQDYFTYFELSQSYGGDPRAKPPASRTWLISHVT